MPRTRRSFQGPTAVRSIADAHLGEQNGVRAILDNVDSTAGIGATIAGGYAALYGRPPSIEPSDAVQVAESLVDGTKRPVTPAEASIAEIEHVVETKAESLAATEIAHVLAPHDAPAAGAISASNAIAALTPTSAIAKPAAVSATSVSQKAPDGTEAMHLALNDTKTPHVITVTPLEAPLIDAGQAILPASLGKLKDFVDGTLSDAATQVEPLTGKEIAAGEQYIDATANGTTGAYVKMALGLGSGLIASGQTTVDEVLVAGLTHLQGQLDSEISAIGTKIGGSASVTAELATPPAPPASSGATPPAA